MTGKELIQATYRHEPTPRPPWVPYAGVHAGKFKSYTATEILKDADKLYECLMEVHRLYQPDGQPIAFDLQLEAEVLGCDMIWAMDNPPSVITHPLEGTDEIPTVLVGPNDGRIPVIMDVTRRMKQSVGDETALFGLFCGPFTLASHLRGTKLFMDMKRNPEHVKKLMNYAAENGLKMVDYYIEAGADIITPVDPLVSQISPKSFRDFLAEPYNRIFEYIRSKGYQSAFFVCGNALRNIEEMCFTKPDGISIDENIPMPVAKEITDRYNIAIGGNIPLTTTMLFGNQQDNMKYVVDMVDSVDLRNLVIAPGCDMPYDVPIENGIAVSEAARNIEMYREMLKNYESTSDDFEVELADYERLERPLIEAMTLDSAQCAACGYMWAVVMDAKEKFSDRIDVVEYKYSTREGIARCKKMGVKNLPSLYMNGKLYYSSIIPSHDEFYTEIEKLL